MKKVCIIGAGAAGLAAIRYVSESPYLEGTVFEQNDKLGGLWVYSDKIRDEKGEQVHSSMYASLR
jgi:cation diffusion facilitator CzcD-associated flavoprotein CzcO